MARSFASRFKGDQRGGVLPLFALSIVVLLGFGVMAVDVGSLFYERRRQQTATDLAALAAATDLARAEAAARAGASANGFAGSALQHVKTGIYTPDPDRPVAGRFAPAPAMTANAVRVELASQAPFFFGRVLALNADRQDGAVPAGLAAGTAQIGTSAIAALDAQASFAIGSRLLQLEGGILNGLLGGLLGTTLSLSVMDYEALARARLDLFTFSRRLGQRLALTGASYNDVLRVETSQRNALLAAVDAAREHGSSTSTAQAALQRVASAANAQARLDLGNLVSFGSLGERSMETPNPVATSLSLLDFLMAAGQISNGARQLDLALAINLPGIASARLRLAIGERPVGTSLVAVGRAGATVHTAQTRLLLTLDLVGSGQASLVRLPLYVEIASATARIEAIECRGADPGGSRVTLAVRPALVDAWIGDVTPARFGDFSRPLQPPPATLLTVAGLARVTGQAHATMTNLAETRLRFDYPEILRAEKKTTSTTNFVASLLARLFGDLDLRVEALGLGLPVPGLAGAVGGVISGAAPPIDRLLTSVLGTLGLGLGQADAWVSGIRCGGAVLVR